LIRQIHAGKVRTWGAIHQFYIHQGEQYPLDKLQHALAALKQTGGATLRKLGLKGLTALFREAMATREWMTKEIYSSREKDYSNPFRKMVYESTEEMNAVVGRLEDNSFIRQEKEATKKFKKEIEKVLRQFGL
jgi:glutamate/tyrosine decarboxylase-like PLP-dependent enzyme